MAFDPMASMRTMLEGYMKEARPLEDMLFVREKVAVVTGGTSGLGFDIALRLLQGGAKVVIASGSQDKGDTAIALFEKNGYGGRVVYKKTNVAEEADVEELVRFTDGTFGSLDIFVNSVGIWNYAHIYDMQSSDFEKVLQVNTVGLFLCIKHISRYMIEHKIKGKITAISSNCPWYPYPVFGGYSYYAASKGAVNALIVESAKELKRFDISVNCVAPGGMATPGSTGTLAGSGLTEEQEDQIYEEIAVTAYTGTQSVDGVAMSAYILSTAVADEITGECLIADNGMSHNIFRFQPETEKYPNDEE